MTTLQVPEGLQLMMSLPDQNSVRARRRIRVIHPEMLERSRFHLCRNHCMLSHAAYTRSLEMS